MKYLVTGDFFLTDIKAPVSLGLATFVFNIPLPEGKSLLKDKGKIALVPCLDEAGVLLICIYWKSFWVLAVLTIPNRHFIRWDRV